MTVCISLAALNKSQQGQLLFERRYNAAKQLHSQLHYIWLNNTPVGFVVKDNNSDNNNGDWNIYAIHTDHLNTPRLLTNQDGAEMWRWASDAFGEGEAVGSIEFNLRFPGQYYDGESGLHYNYFRDYNTQTGRYVQSDPIGLQGGLNTYRYANGNAVNYADILGLAPGAVGGNDTGLIQGGDGRYHSKDPAQYKSERAKPKSPKIKIPKPASAASCIERFSQCRKQCEGAAQKCREQHPDIKECNEVGAPNASNAQLHQLACVNQNCRNCVTAVAGCISPFLNEVFPQAPINPHFNTRNPTIRPLSDEY